jgi:phosphoserine phosphatase
MMSEKTAPLTVALVYDFDGTLAEGSMQEHSLFPALGVVPQEFWPMVEADTESANADGILMYMRHILKAAERRGVPITQAMLRQHGAKVPFFPGVLKWFDRINAYALEHFNLELQHFVVSSGNEEIVKGTPIYDSFKEVFACKYIFDEDGRAVWPAVGLNYTTKTQFLFRISKGIHNYWDHKTLNRWMPKEEKAFPFSRMIFLGDGDSDIPSMELVRAEGGYAFAVFDPALWGESSCQEKVHRLIAEDRISHAAPGDYCEGSFLDIVMKGVLQRIARLEAE